jgi:Ferritin-like domain
MPDHVRLDVPETFTPLQVVEQQEGTRAQLLRRTVVCGGAVLGGAAIWGLPQLTDAAPSEEQDKRVLNLVLALEYVEAAFYQEALARAGLRGDLKEFARIVGEHERAHVAFLRQALGGAAEPEPRHDFGDKTKDADAFTAAAVALEDLVVATYNGQAVNLTPASLKAAARIVSVEGRHAAWIRSIVGEVPAVEATDAAVKEDETRAQLRDFGVQAG